jgi:two-component system, NtrC family, sensor histidine kinase PilS
MSAPSPPGQEKFPSEPPLKRHLQWLFFWRVAVLTLLLGVSLPLKTTEHLLPLPSIHYMGYFIALVYLFTIGSALLLNLITWYRQFAYLQLLIDLALTSLLVVFTGGSKSIFIIVYFFPIVAASYILYRKGGLFMAAAATLLYGLTIFVEYLGSRPDALFRIGSNQLTDPILAMHHFSIPSLTFFLVAILSSVLSERLRTIENVLSRTTLDYDRLSLLYEQIFHDISSGIITIDHEGCITSFNRASEEITGFLAGEVLGKEINHQFPFLDAEQSTMFRPVISLTRKDGKTIPVGYSWSRLNMPNPGKDSRLFTFQDLSQIKRMEEKVKQSEKMAAIGEMAAGIAHEFRNPLAAVSGAAQMLAQDLENDPSRQGLTRIIVRECDRLEMTIREFLQFSRPAKPEKAWFSMAGLIGEVQQLLMQGGNLRENCKLLRFLPGTLNCWADPRQMKQVLINLIHNSCMVLGDTGGEITVTADLLNEGQFTIKVTDNGPGVPEHLREKIFEPFFTTRENGTGLGLAIVRQIIESHGGRITVGDHHPRGCRFTILLPTP